MKRIISLLTIFYLSFPALLISAESEKEPEIQAYQVDASHSTIGFSVGHLGISSVEGKFKKFSGVLQFKNNQLSSAEASIEVDSVDTEEADRDKHLKEDDFFNAEKFKKITFKSTKIIQKDKDVEIHGTLTIRDISKKVVLKGSSGGFVYVPAWKVHKTGLKLQGKINRKDFGLKFNKMLGTGELMVGDIVTLNISLEANKK